MGVINLQHCCASYEYNEEDRHLIRLEKYDGPIVYLYSTEHELTARWIQQINAAANKLIRVSNRDMMETKTVSQRIQRNTKTGVPHDVDTWMLFFPVKSVH